MASATICDRCGKVMGSYPDYRIIAYNSTQSADQYYKYGSHEKDYDICMKCYNEFIYFINKK